jgi:hypothetical protein
MVRTALRRRSGGTVTTVQVADRTGILAASMPQQRTARAGKPPREDAAGAVAGEAEPIAPPRYSAMRPMRRYWLLATAAGIFVVIGWVGGGVFGVPYGGHGPGDPVEAFSTSDNNHATGNDDSRVQAEPAPVPPAALPAPQPVAPPAAAPGPSRVPQRASTVAAGKDTGDSTGSSSRGHSTRSSSAAEPELRSDVATGSSTAQPQQADLGQQLQQMMDAMRPMMNERLSRASR